MMKVIEDLPAGVLGIEGSGTITAQDYETVLIPATDKVMKDGGRLHMVYVLKNLEHFDLAAMWQDTVYGVKHWTSFEKIALVTDEDWVKNATKIFTPFFPGEVKLYTLAELEQAKTWVAEGAKKAA